jgi:drug/metabolite transporter (DMT)-like permease
MLWLWAARHRQTSSFNLHAIDSNQSTFMQQPSSAPVSIFDRGISPFLQAGIAFGSVIVFILVSKLIKLTGLLEVPDRFPWITAASFLLLFALFNSVFSLSADNILKYWGRSMYCFLGLAFASGFAAYLFSSITIDEAGSYRWIYVVLTIGYLVFLGMMAFMRRIVEFAQREEWNHPRLRHKPGKGKRKG